MRKDRFRCFAHFLRPYVVIYVPPYRKGDFFMSKLNHRQDSAQKIKKIVTAGLFAALAYVAMFMTSWIKVSFLTFDAKDAIITLAGLLFGPLYAIAISLTVALIEFITVGDTGIYGFIMNFLSSAVFSTVCALIYKYKKNIKGAIIGLISSIFAMTAAMLLFNLFITPIYMNVPRSVVASMIPTLFLPFNLTKGVMNSALVLVLYKPISHSLKALNILPKKAPKEYASEEERIAAKKEAKRKTLIFSLIITGVGIITIALCFVVFLVVLHGNFSFT